jgi:hypothetical protein
MKIPDFLSLFGISKHGLQHSGLDQSCAPPPGFRLIPGVPKLDADWGLSELPLVLS